jgi:6-phosphogluconolactonase
MTSFTVLPDESSLAQAAAALFTTTAGAAIRDRGRFVVALSGGSTPRATYKLLATRQFAPRIAWTRVHVLWGDERCVPASHAESNFRLAQESLLRKVPVQRDNIHRIRGELPPKEAAENYERELSRVLGPEGRFDLVLLGLGEDGHTASLFPGSRSLEETVACAVPVYVKRLRSWRVTLTLPVINAARQVIFLVSGATKTEALARVRNGERLPAALVQPHSGRLLWLVDEEANDI